MKVTPENARAAYAFLAETEPFVGWNLPDADDIRFFVEAHASHCGICNRYIPSGFSIGITDSRHWHSNSLLMTMAHEMIHVHEYQTGLRVTSTKHGKVFKALAKEVCDAHGFDPGQF